jgi:hypothetical protein
MIFSRTLSDVSGVIQRKGHRERLRWRIMPDTSPLNEAAENGASELALEGKVSKWQNCQGVREVARGIGEEGVLLAAALLKAKGGCVGREIGSSFGLMGTLRPPAVPVGRRSIDDGWSRQSEKHSS